LGVARIEPARVTSGNHETEAVTLVNEAYYSVGYRLENLLNIFPNPASVTIFNLLGTEVLSTQLEGSEVLLNGLPAGMYILSIRSNDQTVIRKLTVR